MILNVIEYHQNIIENILKGDLSVLYKKKKKVPLILMIYPSWQIYGEKMKIVTDFIFLGSKITIDGDFCHEIRRSLLLEKKL